MVINEDCMLEFFGIYFCVLFFCLDLIALSFLSYWPFKTSRDIFSHMQLYCYFINKKQRIMLHQGAPNNNCIFTVFIFDVCWSKTSFSEKKKIKIFFVTAAFKSILTSYKVLFAYSVSTIWIRSAWNKKVQPLPSKKANSWFMRVHHNLRYNKIKP